MRKIRAFKYGAFLGLENQSKCRVTYASFHIYVEVSTRENFRQFLHLLSLAKAKLIFLSCVKDCIEDMATFPYWQKFKFSHNYTVPYKQCVAFSDK